MKQVKTISIQGTSFVIPDTLTERQVQQLGGILLSLKPLQTHYSRGYSDAYSWAESTARIEMGHANIYLSDEEAKQARDARNLTLDQAALADKVA